MRDVKTFDDIPSREALAKLIPDRERFRPEPRFVRAVQTRRLDDGTTQFFRRKSGEWEALHPALYEVHAALADGCTFEEIYDRAYAHAPRKLPRMFEKFLRSHLWELHEHGYIEIPLEPWPEVFVDRYQRLDELGRGGMGVVHLCRDLETDRKVVIKHAWGWSRPIENAENTNRREAFVMARMDHPGIPTLLDTFEHRGLLHMVREFADGPTLSSLRKETPAWPTARRARIGAAIADIYAHMHARGYLYLDSKPGNFILVDKTPLLLDLGLARPHDDGAIRLSGRVGSPGFAAPEVRREKRATTKSDQYGLGCVLFYLAIGKRPSRSWGPEGVPDALAAAGVPEREQEVIARMAAWDDADRYATMTEAREALEGLAREVA